MTCAGSWPTYAMPVKRIIADRFIAPRSGEACAVAEFCRFKGVERKELLKAEAESRLQRMEYESEEMDGWGGPTVGMGVQAGLPEYVAHSLAWNNDMVWTRVEIGREPCTCSTKPSALQHHLRGCRAGYQIFRDMTPEERWLRLRNHVAKKINAPLLEQTA